MEIDPENTALVITDSQNDFLSEEGVTWGVVGESVTANNTVEKPDGDEAVEAMNQAGKEGQN